MKLVLMGCIFIDQTGRYNFEEKKKIY